MNMYNSFKSALEWPILAYFMTYPKIIPDPDYFVKLAFQLYWLALDSLPTSSEHMINQYNKMGHSKMQDWCMGKDF